MLIAAMPFLLSCQKDELAASAPPAAIKAPAYPALDLEGISRENCEPFPFGILALNNGSMLSYGFDITGNLGYSKNVVSTTNTGLSVNGTCYIHSAVGTIGNLLSVATYALPLSVIQNNPTADWRLDEANQHATNLSAVYNALTPDFTYGNITSNKTITSNCSVTGSTNTVVKITSMNLNDERLTLVGAPGSDDGFIINITGNVTLNEAEIKLTNVRPERVLFNFPNNSSVQVKTDTKFRGTILAPTGSVTYQNPQLYHGSIIAKTIYAISYGGNCGSGGENAFLQKTYCNGYQWE